ncbi:MAG: ABC transporter substrate-binding protein [Treponema sp.]|nr:ABC transporter substrate-binding protein [Treponema sp.]
MKRLVLFVFVLVLLAGIAGCSRSAGSFGPTTAGTKKPITFTFHNEDAVEDMPFDDPVAKRITELTGVVLRVQRPVGGDQQSIPLMLASGQYPDIIFAKGNIGMLIEAGAVIPLDELIEKRGNNLKDLYGDQIGRLRNSAEDPRIYTVGTFGVKNAIWQTDGTLQLQHAVLKELGYPQMKTLNDYEQAIKRYMARYPVINGRRTIGFSLLIDTWQWYISLSNPSCFLLGYADDGQWVVNRDTLEATYKFLVPDSRLYYQWLNRMNAEGILDPESFTHKEDEWQAKIASGRVLGIAYPRWGYDSARVSLVNDGLDERTFAYLPITINERYTNASLQDYGFAGGWGISITSSCRDPERAFEFLDWLCSEEAQKLINWGIEGVNYIVVDGKRIVPEEEQRRADTDPDYSIKTGVGRWVHPFPQRGNMHIDSTGNFITRDSPERIKQNYLDVERETLAAYGADMWIDLFPSSESLGISRHGQAWQYALPPDLQAKVVEADNYMKNALANIVLGRPENFNTAWQRIQQDLIRMGIEDANRAMTQMIRSKVELWNR